MDENTTKEMATGTQQPMDTFLKKSKGSGEKMKEKSGTHTKHGK